MPDSWYDPPEYFDCECDCDSCSEGECEECEEPLHSYGPDDYDDYYEDEEDFE